MSFCTIKYEGRGANQMQQAAMLIAYAKKHNLEYFMWDRATNGVDPIYINTFPVIKPELKRSIKRFYKEPVGFGNRPFFQELPKMENVCFEGWFQSYKYINPYRDDILQAFNFPWEPKKGYVGLHLRYGDYLVYSNSFPPVTNEYIKLAVEFMKGRGWNKFVVFSDTMKLAKSNIDSLRFKDCEFIYSTNDSGVEGAIKDFIWLSECDHQIISPSSFSWLAHWFNQNESKICICPAQANWFKGCNKDMVEDSFIQIPY